jgi:superfamily II DNA helicase RecQ
MKSDENITDDIERVEPKLSKQASRVYYRIKEDSNSVNTQKTLESSIPVSLKDEFQKFKKDTAPQIVKKVYSKTYSAEYGYCNSEQFDEILERLKLVRKKIASSQTKDSLKPVNPDLIISIEGLYQFCRKLPTKLEDLNVDNIKNVGETQLKTYGPKFLDEIEHFVKGNDINKDDYYVPSEKAQEKEFFDIQQHLEPTAGGEGDFPTYNP